MGWTAVESEFSSWQRQEISLSYTACRLALDPTQPRI